VGTAFQMIDDVLDFGNQSGKPLGQDVRERVPSLPLIYAADDPVRGETIRSLLSGPMTEPDVASVIELVRESGTLRRVEAEARQVIQVAVERLAALNPESGSRLRALALSAIERV